MDGFRFDLVEIKRRGSFCRSDEHPPLYSPAESADRRVLERCRLKAVTTPTGTRLRCCLGGHTAQYQRIPSALRRPDLSAFVDMDRVVSVIFRPQNFRISGRAKHRNPRRGRDWTPAANRPPGRHERFSFLVPRSRARVPASCSRRWAFHDLHGTGVPGG